MPECCRCKGIVIISVELPRSGDKHVPISARAMARGITLFKMPGAFHIRRRIGYGVSTSPPMRIINRAMGARVCEVGVLGQIGFG